MGMDGVETLNALQWIAELIAMGLGVFFAACFVAGLIAGPDKIKPASIIPEQIEIGYISEPKPLHSPAPKPRTASSSQDREIKRLKEQIAKLKKDKKRKPQKATYTGTGWDRVDVAGNTGDDWNPPEYYEAKKSPSKTTSPPIDSGLMEECRSVLVSLGEKKAQAKKIVKDYFEKYPSTKSVDEFITGVYSS